MGKRDSCRLHARRRCGRGGFGRGGAVIALGVDEDLHRQATCRAIVHQHGSRFAGRDEDAQCRLAFVAEGDAHRAHLFAGE